MTWEEVIKRSSPAMRPAVLLALVTEARILESGMALESKLPGVNR